MSDWQSARDTVNHVFCAVAESFTVLFAWEIIAAFIGLDRRGVQRLTRVAALAQSRSALRLSCFGTAEVSRARDSSE